jgi:inorganic pyrophosphatase/K(+)-stimulated pyrophosphate-energized sodium pump
LAASALGVAAFSSPALLPEGIEAVDAQLNALLLPLAIAGIGILLSIVGIYAVKSGEELSQKALLDALAKGINRSAMLVSVAAILLAIWLMPKVPGTVLLGFVPGIAFSVIIGLAAGWAIGKWTEYSTSDEYRPTQKLAEQAETGSATIIIGGVADGMLSTWVPVVIVCLAMLGAFACANGFNFYDVSYFSLGLYGVGIAAVGMLSTLGITLATDAYGPIADNAGGNAEMAGLEEVVRDRTDALDSLGNTTAATGKGFAIGSAALTALALLAAYVEGVRDGFERWGDDVADVIEGDGVYKLTNDLLLERSGNENTVFMVLPSVGASTESSKAWRSKETTSDVSIIAATNDTAYGKLVDTDASIVSIRDANLRDFLYYYDATLMNPRVLVGVFLGAMSTFLFCM